ncbi:hypothetical protein BDV93DRAFT_506184 [Ceratobasidium sp. AG-I]|nr:hypothetical protein BDV93DRAFT_506184 [Ceratobasidium sp. AG-I]
MPAANPLNQQAARAFELSLQEVVTRQERSPVKLDLFAALPKQIQCSGQLLEVAPIEAKVLLEFVQAQWDQSCKAQQERKEQLVRAQALPHNIECLQSPDLAAWNGLGCCKKRCRAFDAVGRAFAARHRTAVPASIPQPIPAPVSSLIPASMPQRTMVNIFAHHPMPTCPSTPPDIREVLYNTNNLVYVVNGPADGAQYGLSTPVDSISPELSLLPPVLAYPVSLQPGTTRVFDMEVDPHFAWIVARGRCAWAPYLDCSLQEAAFNVASAEGNVLGLLGALAQLLFPEGVRQEDLALDPVGLEVVFDLVHG